MNSIGNYAVATVAQSAGYAASDHPISGDKKRVEAGTAPKLVSVWSKVAS